MAQSPAPWRALAATLLVQILVTLLLAAASVLAPAVAPTLGLAPERIGMYAAVAYLCAMLAGLRAGRGVARFGALPLSQLALVAGALGALLAAAMPWTGSAWTLIAAAVLIGSGYGMVNPASTAVLAHHAPVTSRGLFFSLKQTGVPIGVALAGLLMPAGLATIGWRASAVLLAASALLLAVALLPFVRPLEPPRTSTPLKGIAEPLWQVWRSPVLRRLSLASLAYAMTQQVYVTFVVALLHLDLGWSLAAAAALLSLSQLLAVVSRVAFGALADRTGRPALLLTALGLLMATACIGLALLSPATPALIVSAAALFCASTAMGWNGVFFTELALRVKPGEIARVAGATQFFTFGGGMLGPLVFGEAVRAGSSYGVALAVLALVPLAAGVAMGGQARAAGGPGRT